MNRSASFDPIVDSARLRHDSSRVSPKASEYGLSFSPRGLLIRIFQMDVISAAVDPILPALMQPRSFSALTA